MKTDDIHVESDMWMSLVRGMPCRAILAQGYHTSIRPPTAALSGTVAPLAALDVDGAESPWP